MRIELIIDSVSRGKDSVRQVTRRCVDLSVKSVLPDRGDSWWWNLLSAILLTYGLVVLLIEELLEYASFLTDSLLDFLVSLRLLYTVIVQFFRTLLVWCKVICGQAGSCLHDSSTTFQCHRCVTRKEHHSTLLDGVIDILLPGRRRVVMGCRGYFQIKSY